MISFSSWNGVEAARQPVPASPTCSRASSGFTGFVVSDWNGIDQIDGAPGFTASRGAHRDQRRHRHGDGAERLARRSSRCLRNEVQAGAVPMARIDDANRRILTKKFELGLFERPLRRPHLRLHGRQRRAPRAGPAGGAQVAGAAEERRQRPAARRRPAARSSWPARAPTTSATRAAAGPSPGRARSGAITPGTTILQGIRRPLAGGRHGHLQPRRRRHRQLLPGGDRGGRRDAVRRGPGRPARRAHGPGHDRPGHARSAARRRRAGGRGAGLRPAAGHRRAAADWKRAASPPGCPAPRAPGVADVLFGEYAPTGKLPVTWMQPRRQQPINDGDGKTPLFAFGFGLTWSTDGGGDVTAPQHRPGWP